MARAIFNRRRQLSAVGFQGAQLLLHIFLARRQVGQAAVNRSFGVRRGLRGRRDFFLRLFGPLHQFEFLVLELDDYLPAGFDFVRQRPVFLVLFGLELLGGIPLDLLLLGLHVKLELFAVGLDLFDTRLAALQAGLRRRQPGMEFPALGGNSRQFILELQDVTVAVLQDQKFFNDVEHRAREKLSVPRPQVNPRKR